MAETATCASAGERQDADRFPDRSRARYRHCSSRSTGDVATLLMDVDEKGALFDGYELKLNSYDLGVDIELADAIERLRFEHPQVRVVVLALGQAAGVLRRRQYPHAGRRHPRPQGLLLLQIHQRDPQRHRGLSEHSGLKNHLRHSGHGGRRRLRNWRSPPTTSC